MLDKNSRKKTNIEFIINNAQLSTAKRKLEEDNSFEFRLKIIRTNRSKGISETKFSKRVALKESLMFFDDNKILFTDIDEVNDSIEFIPLIGGPKDKGKKYDPILKSLRDFKLNETLEELWILKSPPNSFIKLKILMYNCTYTDMLCSKFDTKKLNSISTSCLEAEESFSANSLNNGRLDLNSKNSDIITKLTNENQELPLKRLVEDEIKINELKNYFEKKMQPKEDPATTTRLKSDKLNISSAFNKQNGNQFLISPIKLNQNIPLIIDKKPPIYTNISFNDNLNNNIKDTLLSKKIGIDKLNELCNQPHNLNLNHNGVQHPISINYNASIAIQHPNALYYLPNNNTFKTSTQGSLHECNNNQIPSNLKILESEDLKIDDDEEIIPDSFCEAFFGVSLPTVESKIINDSEKLTAPCGHSNCSIFDAYKPEITFRFPQKDQKKLEINSIIASLCFPKGIKMCLSSRDKDLNQIHNFLIANTNETGTRYYIMTYHYYVKYLLKDFTEKYKINPAKDYLNLEKENKELELYSNNPSKQKIITDNIEKKLKICSDFFFNEYIYIPSCICLLSRFPYAKQMEKCLEVVLKLSCDDLFTKDDINRMILHLIREIPIPPPNKRLMFFVPYLFNPIEICGILYRNLPILNYHLKILIDLFSIENIILVHHLMLSESKILFVADSFAILTEIIEGFVALLYPLQWTYPYIPILSEELIKYIQTPLPFIMGIENTMLNLVCDYLNDEEDIFLVYINKNTVAKFSKLEKKFSVKQLLKNLTPFPEENEKEISNNLKEIRKILTDKKNTQFDQSKVDKKIRQVFSRSMVRLFGDYGKYLSFVEGVPLFNKESYLINHSSKDRAFFERIVDSQHFNFFLQYDIKEVFPYFHKLCLRYSNNLKMKSFVKRSNSLSKMKIMSTDKNSSSTTVHNKSNKIIRNSSVNDNNSDNVSNNSISTILDLKGNDYLENFLITPYYISDSIFTSNVYQIEELITLRFKDSSYFTNEINRVIVNQKDFDLLSTSQSFRRYIIPEYKLKKKDIVNLKDSGRISMSNYVTNSNSIEGNSNKQYDTMINDYLRQILTSKKLTASQKKNILGFLKFREARKILSEFLFQKRFLEHKSLCLSDSSFTDLYELTFNCLLQCNGCKDNEYEKVRLITKSLFFYYKYKHNKKRVDSNNKQKYLYQEIIKQNGTFNIWKEQGFWEKWFEIDIIEVENNNSDDDTFYFNILIALSKLMIDLKIELLIISDCINNISKSRLKDGSSVQELQIVIKKQYNLGKR